jgi:hypothetical protein
LVARGPRDDARLRDRDGEMGMPYGGDMEKCIHEYERDQKRLRAHRFEN